MDEPWLDIICMQLSNWPVGFNITGWVHSLASRGIAYWSFRLGLRSIGGAVIVARLLSLQIKSPSASCLDVILFTESPIERTRPNLIILTTLLMYVALHARRWALAVDGSHHAAISFCLSALFCCAVMPAVVVRQRKPWRRKDGVYIYFEDNAGVIVNPKGEMKGAEHCDIMLFLKGTSHLLAFVHKNRVTKDGWL